MRVEKWQIADRISDAIVDILSKELADMREHGNIKPFELLAGQLLAFKALERTMPPCKPLELDHFFEQVNQILSVIMEAE